MGRNVYVLEMMNCCGFNLLNCVIKSLTNNLRLLNVEFYLHITEFRIYVHGGRKWNTFGYARSLTETGLPLGYWTSLIAVESQSAAAKL